MGRVWRATDEMLDRQVAVKEMRIDGLDPEDSRTRRERTLREARATARIDHPHVVRVYDVVDAGERLWIVMELVDGRSLERLVAEDGPLGVRDTARIGLELVDALGQVHAQGVLHRDIKPANVLVKRTGSRQAVLTDFGIAAIQNTEALTMAGMLVGSPDYMAPERVSGRPQGPPSDLWSLGATLCAALGGRSPFSRSTTLATLHAVLYEEPELPAAAGALHDILDALLKKQPESRPGLHELTEALRDIATGPAAGPGRAGVGAGAMSAGAEEMGAGIAESGAGFGEPVAGRSEPVAERARPLVGFGAADPWAGTAQDLEATPPQPAHPEPAPAPAPAGRPTPVRPTPTPTVRNRPDPGPAAHPQPQQPPTPQPDHRATTSVRNRTPLPPPFVSQRPAVPGNPYLSPPPETANASSEAPPASTPELPSEGAPPPPGGSEAPTRPRPTPTPTPTPMPPGELLGPPVPSRRARPTEPTEPPGPTSTEPPEPPAAPTEPAAPPRNKRRIGLVAATAVAVTAAVAAVVVPGMNGSSDGRDDKASSSASPSTPSPTHTPTVAGTSRPPGLPPGARTEAGVFAWVPPEGFSREVHAGAEVHYTSPDARQEIVGKASLARGDLLEQWRKKEKSTSEGPGYSRIRLEETEFRGEPAVVWEYTVTAQELPWHVRSLGFDSGGKSYQLTTWYHPDIEDRARPVYEKVEKTFTPL
ncbi:serine/threonine-protein kinase [Streptomyces europaeiscabiei]|uniref:serine/threonine-protein kinase n=1 Tax=Streptomyces europaeiscabiei TaxID=146819 RepID=UPI0029A5CB74|nr:serine/threonine-protein kinase [Streptomyces europaeiscabiei]MDX3689710.1 serine/threonine-protein kinase [Streptomyces europaeiscabiei]